MADFRLTELQLEIMNVLWTGDSSIEGVRDALRPERELARSTVATLLSRLEKRGVVRHRTEGRHFVYSAAVEPARVQRSLVGELTDLLDRMFGGDVTHAVSHLLSESDVDAGDLARVRELIERKEAELERQGDGE